MRLRPKRSGVCAAELAVILPALMLLILGCIDFGRFGYYYVAVVNATRAGAEYAIMNPYTTSQQSTWMATIQQKARDELYQQTNTTANNLTTTTSVTIEGNGARRVQVQGAYASFTTLVPWPGIPSPITIRSSVVMRVIR